MIDNDEPQRQDPLLLDVSADRLDEIAAASSSALVLSISQILNDVDGASKSISGWSSYIAKRPTHTDK